MSVKLLLLYNVSVVSEELKVSAVERHELDQFLATAHLEDQDGLSTLCRL